MSLGCVFNLFPCFYPCFSILADLCRFSIHISPYVSHNLSLYFSVSFCCSPLSLSVCLAITLPPFSLPASLSLALYRALSLSPFLSLPSLSFSLSPYLFLFLFFFSLCLFYVTLSQSVIISLSQINRKRVMELRTERRYSNNYEKHNIRHRQRER